MCKILTPTKLIVSLLKLSCLFYCFVIIFDWVRIPDWILSKEIEFFSDLGCERFITFFWCIYWFEFAVYVWKPKLILNCCFLSFNLFLLWLSLTTLLWKSSVWSLNLLISLLIWCWLRSYSLRSRHLLPWLLNRWSLYLELRLLRDYWLRRLCRLLDISLLRNRF